MPQVGVSLFVAPLYQRLNSLTIGLTEAEVRKELAEEEERRAVAGIVSPHETTASAFIFLGIEIEDMQ